MLLKIFLSNSLSLRKLELQIVKYLCEYIDKDEIKRQQQQLLQKIKRFGLKLDSWSIDDEHFIAVFAYLVEEIKGKKREVCEILLFCSVHADIDNEEFDQLVPEEERSFGLSAADLFEYLMQVLVGD